MPGKKNMAWLEKLAKWQGKIGAVVSELSKNQDELDERYTGLWKAHAQCREEMLTAITELKTVAKQEGRRWGLIVGLIAGSIASIIVGIITALIMKALGG